MPLRKPVFLTAGRRTPIGRFGGGLASLTAVDLGVAAVRGTLEAASLDPSRVDELIFGNGRQAGTRPNVARQVLYRSGIPQERSAHTINKACGSGLQSIVDAARLIQLDEASIVVAGGTESMSNTPYLVPQARWGAKAGHVDLVDGMYRDGFQCPLCDLLMGETAEKLAAEYNIDRSRQDTYAARSQQRCQQAREAGLFAAEIVPVEVSTRKGSLVVDSDEHPRDGVTAESLARLPPVFDRENGTVHAGNSSGITDGAAAVVVSDEAALDSLSSGPTFRIVDYAAAGVDPTVMGIGPVPAVRDILRRNDLALDQIDLIELNEAFAVQVLACVGDLAIDQDRLNVNGGAIALGHPIGCTGARIVVTLMHEMTRRQARLGLATLCISGGLGMALLLENQLT